MKKLIRLAAINPKEITMGLFSEQTDGYLAANSAVIETEKHIPWWRR